MRFLNVSRKVETTSLIVYLLETTSLGFEDGPDGSSADPGSKFASGINAEDTWTSTLANQEADSVKKPLNDLANDFTSLYDTLVSEKDSPSLQDD